MSVLLLLTRQLGCSPFLNEGDHHSKDVRCPWEHKQYFLDDSPAPDTTYFIRDVRTSIILSAVQTAPESQGHKPKVIQTMPELKGEAVLRTLLRHDTWQVLFQRHSSLGCWDNGSTHPPLKSMHCGFYPPFPLVVSSRRSFKKVTCSLPNDPLAHLWSPFSVFAASWHVMMNLVTTVCF